MPDPELIDTDWNDSSGDLSCRIDWCIEEIEHEVEPGVFEPSTWSAYGDGYCEASEDQEFEIVVGNGYTNREQAMAALAAYRLKNSAAETFYNEHDHPEDDES